LNNANDLLTLDNTIGNSGKVGTYVYNFRNGIVLQNNVLNNDTDSNGYSLSVIAINGSDINLGKTFHLEHGYLTLSSNGNYYITKFDSNDSTVNQLLPNQSLSDSVNYTVSNGQNESSTATLTIDIKGFNHAPTFTSLDGSIANTYQDSQTAITFDSIKTQSNATDIDGSVDGLSLKA